MKASRSISRHVTQMKKGHIQASSMLETLVLFYLWTKKELCMIRDMQTQVIPLKLNEAQKRLLAAMMKQAAAGQPVRIVILKARKVGITTLIEGLFFFICKHYKNQLGITIAHQARATEEIFEITRLIARRYPYPSRIMADEVRFEEEESKYYCHTAGGTAVGAGGTPTLLHLSEVSKWPTHGNETEYIATTSVPDINPHTIIVYESTAQGRDPIFWKKYEASEDPNNMYDPVFIPWYLDTRLKADPVRPFVYNREERDLIAMARADGVEIGCESLQWRRNKIRDLGPQLFRQEYPSSPEEAIQATVGLILPRFRSYVIDSLPFDLQATEPRERYGGMDFGYFDPTCIIHAIYRDQVVYIWKTYHAREKLARDHAGELEDHYTYWSDPASLQDRMELRNAARPLYQDQQFIPAPRRKWGSDRDYAKREWAHVRDLGDQGKLKVLRGAHSQLSIEADQLRWNPVTGEADMTRHEEAFHFDALCAVRYLVMGVLNREGGKQKGRRIPRGRTVKRKMAFRSI